jgi:phosphate transport system substrate-binding protein
MLKKLALMTTAVAIYSTSACAADQIRAVGSSTLYPFVTAAAEQFGKSTKNKTPIVESIGTGGGFKLFCSGDGADTPDMANASRAIKDSEKELCTKNGVKDITEIKIGFDGIVFANSTGEKKISLTEKQIFLALARQIPAGGKLVDNTNKLWSDIDKSLPATKIEVYGPPPTSGTRDAFAELVMDKVCEQLPEFTAAYADKDERKKACQVIREDGAYIEVGENDNLIVQKLEANKHAFGVFGYSYMEENASKIQGASIDGIEPTFENIVGGSYPVSRPLFVYVKNSHVKTTKGLGAFANELASTKAIGEDGYLVSKGLIPLTKKELTEVQAKVAKLK